MTRPILRELASALLLAAVASCGAKTGSADQANGGTTVENATLTKLTLTSDAFADGQAIPAQYTCDGANQSPALQWSDPPQGTRSLALIVDDPDAPSGTYRHWGAYDIPASARSVAAGQHIGAEAVNSFGEPGYGGPCPPKGHGPHHYRFKLYALDVDRLDLGPAAKVIDVENGARKHAIAMGELIGTYERR